MSDRSVNHFPQSWTLDPRANGPKVYGKDGTPLGIGNEVAVELNLLYRWHATLSEKDDEWTQELYQQIFPGQDPSKIQPEDFIHGLVKWSASYTQGSRQT